METPEVLKSLDMPLAKASIRGLEETYYPTATNVGEVKSLFTNARNAGVETLYNIVKASPEVSGCITAIIEDIMADGWKYWGSDSAIKVAERFELNSDLFNLLTNAIMDLLITGNAYILKLSTKEEKVKAVMSKLRNRLEKDFKIKLVNGDRTFEILEGELKKPKDLQLLKSSTMTINYDETGKIISFDQTVRGETRNYSPKDIIHFTLMNVGGQPYGFTPIEPLISDIATLILAKEYAGKYFENDGIPAFIFKMPDASVDDRNYEALKKELQQLKNKSEKFKSLVITGNVEADQLQKFNKDMEFRQLIQHFTQIILIAMGVPAYRLNWTVDAKAEGSSVNRAFEGYYKKISFMQKNIENRLNKELFDGFNVDFVFNRAYKIDEMREAQIVQILTQVGAITTEEARDMMGMDPKLPEELKPKPKPTGDENNINFERDQQQNEQGRANNPPPELPLDNKLKTINSLTKSFEGFELTWPDFLRIVEGRVGIGNFDKANVLYLETDEQFILFFADGSWKYKAKLDKANIDAEAFRTERLSRAIPIRI